MPVAWTPPRSTALPGVAVALDTGTTLCSASSVTQTVAPSGETATPNGCPFAERSMVERTLLVATSMATSVWAALRATHMVLPSGLAAIPAVPAPTGMAAPFAPVATVTGVTVPSALLVTYSRVPSGVNAGQCPWSTFVPTGIGAPSVGGLVLTSTGWIALPGPAPR